MPRQSRIDFPGAFHHVIGRGIARTSIFPENKYKNILLQKMYQLLDESRIKCYGWCIMDNHVHLLMQTGETCLTEFMQRLFTGYALFYNREYKRSGYVFQNRYKSILCDKDNYLLLLIRYIHLNPVKAGVIPFEQLHTYRWTSHQEMLENKKNKIIERSEILSYFGDTKNAVNKYLEFLQDGLNEKKDYEGGGLIRSIGDIHTAIRKSDSEKYDERILGDAGFVKSVFEKSINIDTTVKDIDFSEIENRVKIIFKEELSCSLRSRIISNRNIRDLFVYVSNTYFSKSLTEIGEYLGIKRAAASIALRRAREKDKIIQAGRYLIQHFS